MNLNKNILALLFVACSSTASLAQTQPAAPPAAEESKLKFVDKLNHWFTAYGISSNDFLTAERNKFKQSAYAEAYIQAMIDHPSWMFTMLNKVTEFRFDAKQDPHIIFDLKFKPDANLTTYQVQVGVRASQEVLTWRESARQLRQNILEAKSNAKQKILLCAHLNV